MKIIQFQSVLFVSAFVLVVSSCTSDKKKSLNLPLIQDAQNIISTRSDREGLAVAIVQLKHPALLSVSKLEKGQRIVGDDDMKNILSEQKTAIDEIQKISSELKIVYRYKYVLNGLAVAGPEALLTQLSKIGVVDQVVTPTNYRRPVVLAESQSKNRFSVLERNSLKFIGAYDLHQKGITGKGLRVGVLDTGIDFTHKMLGGFGTVEAYKSVDPSQETPFFPNAKVVAGVDLAGTDFDSSSPDFFRHIPRPDENPFDEGGHGTHVAGTIAGIGDGIESYDGISKDADLYAIKVFGAGGTTSDTIVIAGLEYAVDPNGDGKLDDQLDVVNLSLGSSYGNPNILYAEAVKNLVRGGTIAVMSAGNSGAQDYIVGAPGTSTEALSVAASIDNGDHNWKFPASVFKLADRQVLVESIDAASTIPAQDSLVSGSVVYVGNAATDFSPELSEKVKGQIALIDRGVVAFNDKIKRAVSAGAVGVVMVNNKDDAPFKMGTTDKFEIPAIMISLKNGVQIKKALAEGVVVQFSFASLEVIEKPEKIDTITDFSSKGPRSIDGYLKPEISAPGSDIISAEMGGGHKTVKLSGTSMASPHMAGAMVLLKQALIKRGLQLSALEMKNIAMGTSVTISENGERYPVTRQGSGRTQIDRSAEAQIVAQQPSLSFGEINVESKKVLKSSIDLKNLTDEKLNLSFEFIGNEFVQMKAISDLVLDSESEVQVPVVFTFDSTKMKSDEAVREMDGWVIVKSKSQEIYRVPVLAIAHKMSKMVARDFIVESSANDYEKAAASVQIKNLNQNAGDVHVFHLIGFDDQKPMTTEARNSICDLQALGYKIVEKKDQKNQSKKVIQFGVKLYKSMTTWHSCDISILVDSDKDGEIEQEILGATVSSIPGQEIKDFATTVIDAKLAKQIRKNLDLEIEKAREEYKDDPESLDKALDELKKSEDYEKALLSQGAMLVYQNSSVAVLEVDVDVLSLDKNGKLNFKAVVTANEASTNQYDDPFLASQGKMISVNLNSNALAILPDGFTLEGGKEELVEFNMGTELSRLMILMPQNKMTVEESVRDEQMMILKPIFRF